jgi:hypothetical protein
MDHFEPSLIFVGRVNTRNSGALSTEGRQDTQHNHIQHNDTQYNNIQHNDTQHNDIQNNDTQHNDIQRCCCCCCC